jgi:hypothetical protein
MPNSIGGFPGKWRFLITSAEFHDSGRERTVGSPRANSLKGPAELQLGPESGMTGPLIPKADEKLAQVLVSR